MRLLLAEDDRMIGESMVVGLRGSGFCVDWVTDGFAADTALLNGVYDVLLLDLGLPRKQGMDVLRALRARGNSLPVLVVTARDAVSDCIAGLDGGADDYIVKPFDLDELEARIRAVVRRHAGHAEPLLRSGGVVLNPATREASMHGEPLHLSVREFALLEALLERPGVVLSRSQLEDKLYGWNEEVESNIVEVYVHSLRKKLGFDFIRNVRNAGYVVSKA